VATYESLALHGDGLASVGIGEPEMVSMTSNCCRPPAGKRQSSRVVEFTFPASERAACWNGQLFEPFPLTLSRNNCCRTHKTKSCRTSKKLNLVALSVHHTTLPCWSCYIISAMNIYVCTRSKKSRITVTFQHPHGAKPMCGSRVNQIWSRLWKYIK
jgi:uncharacterized protein with PQ loop repeat